MILSARPQTLPKPGASPIDLFDEDIEFDSDWNVVLLDDDFHSYDYVVEMLGDIFGYEPIKAYGFAIEVDMKKRVTLWTGARERAEAYQEKIHEFGADPRMEVSLGSMSAILEPVF